jgi:hypothetical protein
MDLTLRFQDGDAGVTVRNGGGTRKPSIGKAGKRRTGDEQGSLL